MGLRISEEVVEQAWEYHFLNDPAIQFLVSFAGFCARVPSRATSLAKPHVAQNDQAPGHQQASPNAERLM